MRLPPEPSCTLGPRRGSGSALAAPPRGSSYTETCSGTAWPRPSCCSGCFPEASSRNASDPGPCWRGSKTMRWTTRSVPRLQLWIPLRRTKSRSSPAGAAAADYRGSHRGCGGVGPVAAAGGGALAAAGDNRSRSGSGSHRASVAPAAAAAVAVGGGGVAAVHRTLSARGEVAAAETAAVVAAAGGDDADVAVAVGAAAVDDGDDPENRREVNAWQAITKAATFARPEYSLDRSSFRRGR